ncbi:hypothetical protein [Acinetobacter sp. WCHAc010052]|uniref:hypothetical protein n=1 Tax=Acinetobacter sp. WCHAc010052 TaxID=2004647 RepID=UPI000B3C0458|nr:hypothetical protein [Acinetobacter sp. WCHAc010052]AXY59804.1 hypothetical protein CDG61_07040 [Acinetobacter sp. WCHAc010052]
MHKFLIPFSLLALSSSAMANQPLNPVPLTAQSSYSAAPAMPLPGRQIPGLGLSVSAEYSNFEATLDDRSKIDLDGVALAVSINPHLTGFYGKFEALKNTEFDADYYEFIMGAQINFINYLGLYVLGQVGLGYAWAETPEMYNTVNFMSLPVGLEVGLSLTPELSVYGGVGYKWLWDTTSESVCNDGSPSNSTGNGTCYWHGGVAYYNDTFGDTEGLTYKAGLRFNF